MTLLPFQLIDRLYHSYSVLSLILRSVIVFGNVFFSMFRALIVLAIQSKASHSVTLVNKLKISFSPIQENRLYLLCLNFLGVYPGLVSTYCIVVRLSVFIAWWHSNADYPQESCFLRMRLEPGHYGSSTVTLSQKNIWINREKLMYVPVNAIM